MKITPAATIAGLILVATCEHDRGWKTSSWTGWGGDIYNNRWAKQSAIDSTSVKTLTLHCQLNFTGGVVLRPPCKTASPTPRRGTV